MGAPERHDWAVGCSPLVKRTDRVHRIPPRVRDDREPPLCGTGPNRYSADLPPPSSKISEIQKLTRDPRVRLEWGGWGSSGDHVRATRWHGRANPPSPQ